MFRQPGIFHSYILTPLTFVLQELGVSTNANYKITFMLDSAAMITVHTPRRGLIDVSSCCFA